MKIVMVNDSLSYMYVMDFDDKKDRCMCDFAVSSALMIEDWNKRKALLKFHIEESKEVSRKWLLNLMSILILTL